MGKAGELKENAFDFINSEKEFKEAISNLNMKGGLGTL